MRISDWSSDVCSSDLAAGPGGRLAENFFHSGSFNNSFSMTSSCTAASHPPVRRANKESAGALKTISTAPYCRVRAPTYRPPSDKQTERPFNCCQDLMSVSVRSEEHTSELQSLMRISYAVFCLKKTKKAENNEQTHKI